MKWLFLTSDFPELCVMYKNILSFVWELALPHSLGVFELLRQGGEIKYILDCERLKCKKPTCCTIVYILMRWCRCTTIGSSWFLNLLESFWTTFPSLSFYKASNVADNQSFDGTFKNWRSGLTPCQMAAWYAIPASGSTDRSVRILIQPIIALDRGASCRCWIYTQGFLLAKVGLQLFSFLCRHLDFLDNAGTINYGVWRVASGQWYKIKCMLQKKNKENTTFPCSRYEGHGEKKFWIESFGGQF